MGQAADARRGNHRAESDTELRENHHAGRDEQYDERDGIRDAFGAHQRARL